MYLNIPVYWTADANGNKSLDPDEVALLRFYDTAPAWVEGNAFTKDFEAAYDKIVTASKTPFDEAGEDGKRRELVGKDLDSGPADARPQRLRERVRRRQGVRSRTCSRVGDLIDDLYEQAERRDRARPEVAGRPREPQPVPSQPRPEVRRAGDREGSAVLGDPGAPKPIVDLYPAELQSDDDVLRGSSRRAGCEGAARPVHGRAASGDEARGRAVQRGVQGRR